eukprot:Gregarina_sp_Poly_1__10975@NODE_867_length_5916_cov_55_659771_g627_i0_p2_GENE_NODE_867_length_5916_cov_55_659771_g627_i0NODE_867_length_5916_cov_55_659771_g627_i0_p2_ORF_typecomplete_len404_score45_94_NODE_867_length_5916_cov_55_659771_g627_i011042315
MDQVQCWISSNPTQSNLHPISSVAAFESDRDFSYYSESFGPAKSRFIGNVHDLLETLKELYMSRHPAGRFFLVHVPASPHKWAIFCLESDYVAYLADTDCAYDCVSFDMDTQLDSMAQYMVNHGLTTRVAVDDDKTQTTVLSPEVVRAIDALVTRRLQQIVNRSPQLLCTQLPSDTSEDPVPVLRRATPLSNSLFAVSARPSLMDRDIEYPIRAAAKSRPIQTTQARLRPSTKLRKVSKFVTAEEALSHSPAGGSVVKSTRVPSYAVDADFVPAQTVSDSEELEEESESFSPSPKKARRCSRRITRTPLTRSGSLKLSRLHLVTPIEISDDEETSGDDKQQVRKRKRNSVPSKLGLGRRSKRSKLGLGRRSKRSSTTASPGTVVEIEEDKLGRTRSGRLRKTK